MEIQIEHTSRGYSLSITGPAWNAEPCEIRFPEEVWTNFPAKETLRNELAYILTLAPPLILKHPTVWYSTPEPRFLNFYEECFELAIPNMVEPIPAEESGDILERFRSILRHFPGESTKEEMKRLDSWNPRRVILPFTFGKDSLLSLATLHALGYEVILVNIDERVLPRGKAIRVGLKKQLAEEYGLTCHLVENEIQLLSDWQVLEQPVTQLHQVHIHFIYLFAMIPFCTYYRAPTIVLSNEYENTLNTVHRGGYLSPHIIMQGHMISQRLGRVAEQFSGGQITAVNLIGILDNFSIHRMLHEDFPAYGKYRVTCHMEVSEYARWCHDCYRCAQPFIYFMALGHNPFSMGFEASMLEEDKKPHYSLFRQSIHPKDDYHRFVKDEESLAFLMAHRRGAEGPLMDCFEKEFLRDTEKREASLEEKVFRLQAKPGRSRVEREAAGLYRDLLSKYRSRKRKRWL